MASDHMKRDVATRAFEVTIAFRTLPEGCTHHTDRGGLACFKRLSRRLVFISCQDFVQCSGWRFPAERFARAAV